MIVCMTGMVWSISSCLSSLTPPSTTWYSFSASLQRGKVGLWLKRLSWNCHTKSTKHLHAVGSSEDPAGWDEAPTTLEVERTGFAFGPVQHGHLPGVGTGERLATPKNPVAANWLRFPALGELGGARHRCDYWSRSGWDWRTQERSEHRVATQFVLHILMWDVYRQPSGHFLILQ